METKQLAEQLIKWLPELVAGKTLEYILPIGRPTRETPRKIKGLTHLAHAVTEGFEIRIKQTPIPPAPDWDSWQNPDGLTAEQIGIDQGWRLLLKSEIVSRRGCRPCQQWNRGSWCVAYPARGTCDSISYRVETAKYPVGMLRDPVDERLLEQKQSDISAHFVEYGLSVAQSQGVAEHLVQNKVPHTGVK